MRVRSTQLSLEADRPIGKLMAGLLTCASLAGRTRTPSQEISQWHMFRLFALTVAGQWRIYTAFPYTLSATFIRQRDEPVNRLWRPANYFKHKLLFWSMLWA